MFKIEDCFKEAGTFADSFVRKFEENFDPIDGSRLWVVPAHIVYVTNDDTVHTCDATPYDFSTSPVESEIAPLLTTSSSVLDICFDTDSICTRMFVVLTNGDVQIFEYRTVLCEWARIGYFNVNIVSPNTNNHHPTVLSVFISLHHNMIYWCEQSEYSEKNYDVTRREIPLNGVREITQSSLGVPQKVLINCPKFDLMEIRDNLCIVPYVPNEVNLYIILSPRSHIWLFHIDGKLLWRGMIDDNPIDFTAICMKTIGQWRPTGGLQVCKLLNVEKNLGYILNNDTLLSIAPNGQIRKKTELSFSTEEDVLGCFVMEKIVCIFIKNWYCLQIFNIDDGQMVQILDLDKYLPITGVWSHTSCIPTVGFYSNCEIFKLNYKSLNSLLTLEPPCLLRTLKLYKYQHFHVFTLLRDVIYHRFESCDIPSLKGMPSILQSDALFLAIMQFCSENGYRPGNFPVQNFEQLMFGKRDELMETKLKELLSPMVESYKKLEESKKIQSRSFD